MDDRYPFLPADTVRRTSGGPDLEVIAPYDDGTVLVHDPRQEDAAQADARVANADLVLVSRWTAQP